ncbi:MAG: LytR C-terminal domain-containing protein [Bifidobacterium sp.]|nr:LytR C-terminal domain-containing protein [Bifidobacterium sp.]
MANNSEEREARQAYVRRKQTIVFGVTGAILVVAMIVALLFYFHVGGLGKEETSNSQAENYGVTAPCATTSSDKTPTKYLDNKSVTVRVLNGTSSTGFAQAVASALENREFVVQSVDNYDKSNVERTQIVFGKNAIAQAYTLAGQVPDAELVMDDRQDKLVDLVLGSSFNNLTDTKSVPKVGSAIENREGCKGADQMKDLPKAPEHDSVG